MNADCNPRRAGTAGIAILRSKKYNKFAEKEVF
jgi:hypothetical protein